MKAMCLWDECVKSPLWPSFRLTVVVCQKVFKPYGRAQLGHQHMFIKDNCGLGKKWQSFSVEIGPRLQLCFLSGSSLFASSNGSLTPCMSQVPQSLHILVCYLPWHKAMGFSVIFSPLKQCSFSKCIPGALQIQQMLCRPCNLCLGIQLHRSLPAKNVSLNLLLYYLSQGLIVYQDVCLLSVWGNSITLLPSSAK